MIPKTGTPGQIAEKKAANFLQKKGLKLLTKNYHCRYGEIDLVMREQNTLVFVEVRFRQSNHFGGALASVTPAKQNKLIKTAQHYLMKNNLVDVDCRFDVIGLTGDLAKPNIDWLVNAIHVT